MRFAEANPSNMFTPSVKMHYVDNCAILVNILARMLETYILRAVEREGAGERGPSRFLSEENFDRINHDLRAGETTFLEAKYTILSMLEGVKPPPDLHRKRGRN